MFIVYIIAAAGFLYSVRLLAAYLSTANVPEGYEDADGFHYGRPASE